MMDTTLSRAEFRARIAVRMCYLLREAIERNQNVYSGSLIPNLTSVTDVLTIDYEQLVAEVRKHPQIYGDMKPPA